MPDETAASPCDCSAHSKYHESDCPNKLQAFVIGNAVDGYEVGVVNVGTIMQGRVVRRADWPYSNERKARKAAAKMLTDERRREQTPLSERFT